jgi:hypothetical protein
MRHIAGAEAVRQAQSVGCAERYRSRAFQSKKRAKERRAGAAGWPKRTEIIFHLSTSRRAVYCCAAMESRGLAHRDRLR